jgi:tripartite-type tricarboxylate transporter receptor subunit TctC
MVMSWTARVLFGVLGLACAGSVRADDYPNHPVRIVVPYATGGGVDIAARLLAQQLTEQLKQTFIVEDKPGATGVLGSQVVGSAKPDGHTLLYAATAEAIIPFLPGGASFDVERELTPITLVVSTPFVMVVNPNIPVSNPRELAQYVKQHPDAFRWGLGGLGSPDHLAIELFDQQAGINPVTVPYQGGGPAIIATLSGEVGGIMDPPSLVKSYVDSGQLKGLGIGSSRRSEVMPEMPTIASFGFSGYEASTWYGLWGPRGMSQELADKIQRYVLTALTTPAFKEKMLATALALQGSKPDEFAAFFHAEIAKYGRLIKDRDLHFK